MFVKDYKKRAQKKIRVRKQISGTAERPRLTVFRSLNQIYCQLIDDQSNTTLASASSLSKEIKDDLLKTKGKVERGKLVSY